MARRKRSSKKETEKPKQPKLIEHVTDDEDEEIDEDEAFNSEDERRYGAFFSSKGSGEKDYDDEDESRSETDDSISDDGIASDDDDDEGDGGEYMLNLLNKIDSSSTPNLQEDQAPTTTLVKESEFAASVLKNDNLTMDDLMNELKDTKDFDEMQKTIKKVSKGKTTSALAAEVVSNRAQRKVAYSIAKDDITGWVDVVQQNRQAETLDFRPKERVNVLTKNKLIDKFEPTTKFEKELAAALEKAGVQDEETLQKKESSILVDDLGANEITLEEYEKRRGQLAKMRALMFYHEQKRHHINKIKSKKYRRIRKKQRERMKESELSAQMEEDKDLVREMEEKEEIERMQERMTLAHKNTSKWAKRVLKRGKNVDMDTRKALSAQLHRGEELRRKMNSTMAGDSENDTDSDDENLLKTAKKVLAETEADSAGKVVGNGLFKLSFMQKGIEKQRERAKHEARRLLMELEDNEDENESEVGENDEEKVKLRKKRKKVASAKEMRGIMEKGKLVANSLNFGNSSTIAMDGVIDIDINGRGPVDTSKTLPLKSIDSDRTVTLDVNDDKGGNAEKGGKREMNEPAAKEDAKKSKKKKKEVKESTQNNKVSEDAIDSTSNSNNSANKAQSSSTKASNSQHTSVLEVQPNKDVNGKKKKKEKAKLVKETKVRQVLTTKESKEEDNPWISAAESKGKKKQKKNKNSKIDKNGVVNMEDTASVLLKDNSHTKSSNTTTSNTGSANKVNDKSIISLSQSELVRRAFVTPDEAEIEEDFAKEKAEEEERDELDGKKKKKSSDPETVDGWGSWAGQGAPPPKKPENLGKHLQAPLKKEKKRKRKDEKRPNLILNERRLKKTAKFQIAHIPHPYKSREEYERAMAGAIGKEWNVTSSFKSLTRPDIITRAGKIIQPISKKAKQQRPAAKF